MQLPWRTSHKIGQLKGSSRINLHSFDRLKLYFFASSKLCEGYLTFSLFWQSSLIFTVPHSTWRYPLASRYIRRCVCHCPQQYCSICMFMVPPLQCHGGGKEGRSVGRSGCSQVDQVPAPPAEHQKHHPAPGTLCPKENGIGGLLVPHRLPHTTSDWLK